MEKTKPLLLGKQARTILSIVAYVTMFIDHMALAFFHFTYEGKLIGDIRTIYDNLRGIGRFAFPIFVLFLVEGFFATHSRPKYLLRLGVLALISEVPFDLMSRNQILEFTHQNVMFELFLGLALIWIIDSVCFKWKKITVSDWMVCISLTLIFALIAQICHLDYHYEGIILVCVVYLLKKFLPNLRDSLVMSVALVPLCILDTNEFPAFLIIALIFLLENIKFKEKEYKKNRLLQVVKYLIYPLHFLCFYFIFVC